CFIIQTSVFPLLSIFSSSPNLLLIITFSYALLYGEIAGLITGIFCGLLYHMYLDGTFGIYIFIYSMLGCLNGQLFKSYVTDTISTPIILCIVNTFIYNIYIFFTHFLVRGRIDFFNYLYNIILPNILFTLLFTIILYRFFYYLREKMAKI
ncbi:MAG: rod shape-determining protein MreD, partial [Lachnospiraceae bacterium]|nr:rod shape-determining protein MreD [Lachnospiraceae bacterium]